MSVQPSPAPSRGSLNDLIARARAADGSPPFSDGALVQLATGERSLLWLGPAAALVDGASAEFVVDPDARRLGHGTRMLEHLTTRGELLYWAHGDHPGARALAASHGLVPVRELLHLEAPVPSPAIDTAEISTSSITAIDTELEADEWLDLNARAFAHHPEQGGMTRADLETVMAEPWFDADDFLLLRDEAGTLIGYCWLKVEGGEGEFYVVGVSPDAQGRGLGRLLVEAGFERLARRGIQTAHLYVEGDNAAALALYRSFGFTDRSVDIQYGARAD